MNSASTTLLTEHLRWTPLTLIDDIINTINEILYQSVAAVETFLLSVDPVTLGFTPPPGTIQDTDDKGNVQFSEKEVEEITKGIHALETLLENGVDKYFDSFELYVLRNILVIKPELVGWVRLAHYKNLDLSNIPTIIPTDSATTSANPLPPAHEAQSRIRTLRQTLLASHALNHTLRSEVETNARTLSQLRMLASSVTTSVDGLENPLSFVNSIGAKEIKDSASFAVSQADLIQSLLKKLRPQFDALLAQKTQREAKEAENGGEDTDMRDIGSTSGATVTVTAEEERKRYIERMTRRHMEASRGLRLNAKGEVVGGNFEGSAKKGLGEVELLEGVVADLAGKKEGYEGIS